MVGKRKWSRGGRKRKALVGGRTERDGKDQMEGNGRLRKLRGEKEGARVGEIEVRRKNGRIRGKSAEHTMFPWQKRLVYCNRY